jgi:hypothetical protein
MINHSNIIRFPLDYTSFEKKHEWFHEISIEPFFQPEPFWWFRVVPESRTPFFLEWSKTVGKINRDPNQKDMVPHMSRHVLFEIQQILVNLDQSLRKSELASEQSKIIEALVLGKLRTWSALDTDKALLYIWYFIKVFSHNFVSWINYL